MDMTHDTTGTTTEDLHEVALLRSRATSLRHQAGHLDDVLATTYRRRASELEMEAWILEVLSGVPSDQVHPAA